MQQVTDALVRVGAEIYRHLKPTARSSRFSPKKFSPAQVHALVSLRSITLLSDSFLSAEASKSPAGELLHSIAEVRRMGKISYRRLINMLRESGELRDALELRQIPDYSTLHKAEGRLGLHVALVPLLLILATHCIPKNASAIKVDEDTSPANVQ